MAARLSGRYVEVRVHPLSFPELLSFRNEEKRPDIERAVLFEEFLRYGGYPRVVLEGDEYLREELLKSYYQTVFMRDIIIPNTVRNPRDVQDLLFFLLSNIGNRLSYSRIGRAIGLSPETVREYIGHAERCYLLSTLNMYDPSVRRQIANPKKIYCLDTGMVSAISFRFSENRGRMLENLVCNELRRRGGDIYYHGGRYECDFLVRERSEIVEAIQVTTSMSDEDTRKREIRGLVEAMDAHGLEKGLILTDNGERTLDVGGRRIDIVSIRDWMMN